MPTTPSSTPSQAPAESAGVSQASPLYALASTTRLHLAIGTTRPQRQQPLCGTRADLGDQPVPMPVLAATRENLAQLAELAQRHGQGSLCRTCAHVASRRVGPSSPLGAALQGIGPADRVVPAAQAPPAHLGLLRRVRQVLATSGVQALCSLPAEHPQGAPVRVRARRDRDLASSVLLAAGLGVQSWGPMGLWVQLPAWAEPPVHAATNPTTRQGIGQAQAQHAAAAAPYPKPPVAPGGRCEHGWLDQGYSSRPCGCTGSTDQALRRARYAVPTIKAQTEGYVAPQQLQHAAPITPSWLTSPAGRRYLQRGLGNLAHQRSEADTLTHDGQRLADLDLGLPAMASRHAVLRQLQQARALARRQGHVQPPAHAAGRSTMDLAWQVLQHGRPYLTHGSVGYRWGQVHVVLHPNGSCYVQGPGRPVQQRPYGACIVPAFTLTVATGLTVPRTPPQAAALVAQLHHVGRCLDRTDDAWREDELLRTRVLGCFDFRPRGTRDTDTNVARVAARL